MMINYMIDNDILPDPDWISVEQHTNIIIHWGRRRYRHPIYLEYRANVPANLHRAPPDHIPVIWHNIPIHLRLLVPSGNDGARW